MNATDDGEMAEAAAQWQRVRGRLRSEFGDAAYKSWLKPLRLASYDHGNVVIAAPSRLMREWVVSRYADRIRALWRTEDPRVRSISIAVEPAPRRDGAAIAAAAEVIAPAPEPTPEPASPSEAELLGLDARNTFETFVVGDSNRFAHRAAHSFAEGDAFSPLYIHGGVGLGKTHLLHAIAWRLRERLPSGRVRCLSAERFTLEFVQAVRNRDTIVFKDRLRGVDVLLIDDLQFIGGKDTTQEEFLHTFNVLTERGRKLVVTADCPPSRLKCVDDRLRSRLGSGLTVAIEPADYGLRLAILEAKLARLGQGRLAGDVLPFLARRITANVRVLEGALNQLIAHGTYLGVEEVTVAHAQTLLHDLLRDSERRITIDEIQRTVADFYGIRLADMHSPRRARAVARPRQIAMALAKQLTSRSLPEIGRHFGGRDHTTVMHAVKRIEALRREDPSLDEEIERLKRALEG